MEVFKVLVTSDNRHSSFVIETLVIAAIYWALARLGQFVAIHPGNVTPVWPASGFALAVVMRRGYRTWLGIWIGSALAAVSFLDLSTFYDGLRTLATGLALGPGVILQAFLGAYLIRECCSKQEPFERTRNVFTFVGTQAVACLSSATLGVLALCVGQVLPWPDCCYTWLTWYLGDGVGVILVAPFLLTSHHIAETLGNPSRTLEATLSMALGVIATLLAFGDFIELPLVFLPLPFVLWAAVRGGPFAVATTVIAVAAVAIFHTAVGYGPFVSVDPNASLLSLQVFAAVTAVTGLAVSAALCEHQSAEQALRKTMDVLEDGEARYRELFENANDLVFALDLDGRFTSLNKSAEDTTGFSRDELVGADVSKLVPPEYVDKVREMMRRKIETQERTTYEIKILTKNGSYVPIEVSSRLVHEDGEPVSIQGVARDITERKRAEKSFADIVSGLTLPRRSDAITTSVVHLHDLTLEDLNRCGAAIRGMSIDAGSKREFEELLVRFFYERFVDEQGQSALALVRCFEIRSYHDLDEELRVFVDETSGHPASDMMCMTLVATAGDQDAWNDIRRSARHRAIALPDKAAIKQLPMISQLVQQLGFEVAVNQRRDEEIVIHDTLERVFHVPEAKGSPYIPAQDDFVIPFGIRSVVGFGDVLPNGSLFVVIMFSKIPISHETATLFSHLSISVRIAVLPFARIENRIPAQLMAVDQLVKNQEQIVARQESQLRVALEDLNRSNAELERSNKELQQFAYSASHDLQEPLRSIAGFCQLLQRRYKGKLDREGEEWIDYAVQAAIRMRALVEDLLDYSRVDSQALPFRPVEFSQVVDDAVSILAKSIEESGANITRDELPTVVGDRSQLLQVAQNLIGNGIKFHHNNRPHVHVSAQRNGDDWTISVRDNGVGIPAEKRESIFEMFRRLHTQQEYPGTGIGLAICRRIVERHGGKIWVEAAQRQGSTFYFTLKPSIEA